jgi:hypothetical protein
MGSTHKHSRVAVSFASVSPSAIVSIVNTGTPALRQALGFIHDPCLMVLQCTADGAPSPDQSSDTAAATLPKHPNSIQHTSWGTI